MIQCVLINIDNDNRAVICVGEGEDGEVKSTGPISWHDIDNREFCARGKIYSYAHPSSE